MKNNSSNIKEVSGYKLLLGYLGLFMIMIGIIILIPLLVLIFYPEELENAKYFIIPGVLSIVLGYFVHKFIIGKQKQRLAKYQDALLTLSIWIMAIIFSSFPFLLTGDYNITQSIFEATSGYTTTGLTVIDVTVTPRIFLMYRSFLQFVGGVGLVLVLTSTISDRYGMKLYSAEGHNDKLLPNLARSARLILTIYSSYIIIGAILYTILGMSFFDAINHSIAAVATGGFSTKTTSIAYFNSVYIEAVTIVLMILGNTNFVVHLYFLKGRIKEVIKHVELKFLFILSIILVPIMTISVLSVYNGNWGEAFRIGIFQFFTGITGTGFSIVNPLTIMPNISLIILIIVMVIGGGIGSTAGGIKQYRVALAVKNLFWNFRDRISSKNIIRTKYVNKFGKNIQVSDRDIIDVNSYVLVYITTLIVGTLIFSAHGYNFQDSLFEFSSALGTVGLSVGIISYNSPSIMLWTSSIGMLLGRLEFYVIFVAIAKIVMDISKRKAIW
ncbi:MAG: TrkH family potassium uptake protein [Candidatus Izimaplasma sp.]|nr:TrkH family potassium uptake protein [Candidatus Izimaplasma bacterium]